MKKAGWFLIVFGSLSFLGCLRGGLNPSGPLFWIGLGAYLVHRGKQKEQEEIDKEEWKNKK